MPFVRSVACNPEHGFSKQPRSSITLIAGEGVEGDAHRGQTVQHLYRVRQDATQPNLAQVHLLPSELLSELAAKGFSVEPGDLGENVLTEALDLLHLPLGTVLRLGPEAVLQVTGLRTPCAQIDKFRTGLQKHLWGERDQTGQRTRRAGIMTIVLAGGEVKPGDKIQVELPEPPFKPLPPV